MDKKFDVLQDVVEDGTVELKRLMSLVAENKMIIIDNLFDSEETGIHIFNDLKNLIFLKGNKKLTIKTKSNIVRDVDDDLVFINKVKPIGISNLVSKKYFVYMTCPTKEDYIKSFKNNPIEFVRKLEGEMLPGMIGTCFEITNEVNNFIS